MTTNTAKTVVYGSILTLITAISTIVINLNRVDSSYLAFDPPLGVSGIYKCYIDDNPIPVTLTNVTCDDVTCKVPIKNLNLTAGHHLIQITTTVNGIESPKSVPIEVNFIISTSGGK